MSLFTPRRVMEFGLLVSMAGALMIAIGAGSFLRTPTPTTGLRQRWWTLVGGLVLAVGFVIQIAGLLAK
jgi:hypothetical protein